MTYFKPRYYENNHFWIVNHVEGWRGYEGAEALRRSSTHFNQFQRSRIPGGPWIMPRMKVEPVSDRVHPKQQTDIFLYVSSLLVSGKVRKVMQPYVTDEVEFLPVDLTSLDEVFWVRPPIIEGALDTERSETSGRNNTVTVDRIVLKCDGLTDDHIFSIHENDRTPILSDLLVEAIEEAGFLGVDFQELEQL